MSAKTIWRAAATAALLFSAIPANAATIFLTPSAANVTVGSNFTVDVMAEDVNLGGFDLVVIFKPLLSSYVSTQFGSALGNPDNDTFYQATANLDVLSISQVSFITDAATLDALQGALPNVFKLATLTFKADAAGTATFNFDLAASGLTDYVGRPLPAEFVGTSVTIGAPVEI